MTQHDVALTRSAMWAELVNMKHRAVLRRELNNKEEAAEIGEVLIKVKEELPHGEFTPWVRRDCSFTDRHARNYIRIAQVKRKRVSDFDRCTSIREVLSLGKPQPEEPKRPTRAATLDDLRKVERLRSLRDDPSASEGER
ncbi:Protein of unknown function [Cognatiyoonia sediminum]|uniref:DUF3102 domain-containing protein n=1 Tax=Cognatiyoonia sediminum TaxID=1508389 RepID=A0A1M5MD52_9RHOB|nr:DUF3102 domain-containing protein [Cognatiyoonia sediminum]SHG75177.1 Protein of unknown function [Cognatiyoonia sediminum]